MWKSRKILDSEVKKTRVVLFGLLLVGFILSLSQLIIPMTNAHMDAYWRANWAITNFNSNSWINNNAFPWLPLHPVLLGLPLFIFNNPQLTPRLTTLFFSLFSVVLMFYYARLIFRKRYPKPTVFWLSFASAVLYLVLPFRYFLSTQTLSEPLATFFLLLVLILFTKDKPNYVLGLIILNIAEGLRYEFWLLIPLIWLIIITKRDIRLKRKICYMLFSVPLIVSWLVRCYIDRGNVFSFILNKANYVHEVVPWNLMASIGLVTERLTDMISKGGVLLALIGLYKLAVTSSSIGGWALVFPPIYFFTTLIVQVFIGTMEWLPHRYLFSVIVPGIPFIIAGSNTAIDFISSRIHVSRIFITTIMCGFFLYELVILYDNPKTLFVYTVHRTELLEATAYYLRHRLASGRDKTIYIEAKTDAWNYPAFEYFTQNHDFYVFSKDQYVQSNGSIINNMVAIYEKDPDENTSALRSQFNVMFENDGYLIVSPSKI